MEQVPDINRDNLMDNAPALCRNEVKTTLNNSRDERIECFVDRVKFTCIWQQSEVNAEQINDIMGQMNIDDTNEYGDQTPSNIAAFLSTSLESNAVDNLCPDSDDEMDVTQRYEAAIVSSTPVSQFKKMQHDPNDNQPTSAINNDNDSDIMDFSNASPIMCRSGNIRMLTRRRLNLS